jgi:hypothetical protein
MSQVMLELGFHVSLLPPSYGVAGATQTHGTEILSYPHAEPTILIVLYFLL